ncbi:hypothetical protein [Streptomyces bikiniensis]|uniref:hypothetical protein n=1 Tax=Streptomyces bikiniensis TaxID=1896 RepID=UPI00068F181A|nr:hypothetical protein [Streptomyces bikiniensis]
MNSGPTPSTGRKRRTGCVLAIGYTGLVAVAGLVRAFTGARPDGFLDLLHLSTFPGSVLVTVGLLYPLALLDTETDPDPDATGNPFASAALVTAGAAVNVLLVYGAVRLTRTLRRAHR